jgi:hypothetical protein
MSSHGSPTLVLELRQARSQQAVALSFLILVGLAPFLVFRTVSPFLAIASDMAVLAVLAITFRMVGWLGGVRSLSRVVWRSDGVWRLIEAGGGEFEGRLLPTSRMSPVAIWLQWLPEPASPTDVRPRYRSWVRTRALLLLPCDLPDADFRRLLVRLRLDRSECPPTAAQANS